MTRRSRPRPSDPRTARYEDPFFTILIIVMAGVTIWALVELVAGSSEALGGVIVGSLATGLFVYARAYLRKL